MTKNIKITVYFLISTLVLAGCQARLSDEGESRTNDVSPPKCLSEAQRATSHDIDVYDDDAPPCREYEIIESFSFQDYEGDIDELMNDARKLNPDAFLYRIETIEECPQCPSRDITFIEIRTLDAIRFK